MKVILLLQKNIHKFVVVIVFGSGLINLISAAGKPLPYRQKLLLNLFPIEFLEFSNFLTVILWVALAVTAINLYKRKKRAFSLAVFLSLTSALFHVTKGIDFEESLFSLFVVSLLFASKAEYYVKSNRLNLSLTIYKTLTVLGFADEKSSLAERAVHNFAQNSNFLFSFKGLKQYKEKYADYSESRYLIYNSIIDLPFIAKALNELAEYPKNK